MSTRFLQAVVPMFMVMAITLLAGCRNQTAALLQANGELYIRENVSSLSPVAAPVGGTYRVTAIEWEDDDTAIVTYEDGHLLLRGRTVVTEVNGRVRARAFTLIDEDGEEISSDAFMSAGSSESMSADSSSSEDMTSSAGTSASAVNSAGVSMSASVSVSATTSVRASAGTTTSIRASAGTTTSASMSAYMSAGSTTSVGTRSSD